MVSAVKLRLYGSRDDVADEHVCSALPTLLSEEEAYMVRDLTMMGEERPLNVFDEAKMLFFERYELTFHQRLTRVLANGWRDSGKSEVARSDRGDIGQYTRNSMIAAAGVDDYVSSV